MQSLTPRCIRILVWMLPIFWTIPGWCSPPPEPIPSLIQSIQFSDNISICGEPVPLKDQSVRVLLEKEMLLALWNRPQVILWLKRAAKYFPHIEAILKEEKMPADLKYVPVVESALRPHSASSANAVGFWQFLKSTGKRYGLRIDSDVDERRNLFKSTRAACKYLAKLHEQFGSYTLALAAYNMGEYGLSAEIDSQAAQHYHNLYLPLETQRYVYKIIAAKLILENPEKYGFIMQKSDLYPVFSFSKLLFSSKEEIPLVVIARAAGISFKTLKDMNPDIRGYYLGKGSTTLLVPKGREKGFREKFDRLYKEMTSERVTRLHIVKTGESLISIAKKYNMSLASLLRLNNFSMQKVIHPGDRVVIK